MAAPSRQQREAARAALEQRLGRPFADRALLEQALTHASVGDRDPKRPHMERLEFLGDRVLGLVAAERLMAAFPDLREGDLTRRLTAVVSGEACAAAARRLELGDALQMTVESRGAGGGRDNDTILGDALEALMAAVYLDGGLEAARSLFAQAFGDVTAIAPQRDPKTALQEWAMARGRPLPAYEVVSQSGPAHAPRFRVRVRVEGCKPVEQEAGSRRAAEKAAAAALLAQEERP